MFEEIATMEYPFEGIPTVPPRKDVDHMAFFCNGCRYRVTAHPDWTVAKVPSDQSTQQSTMTLSWQERSEPPYRSRAISKLKSSMWQRSPVSVQLAMLLLVVVFIMML